MALAGCVLGIKREQSRVTNKVNEKTKHPPPLKHGKEIEDEMKTKRTRRTRRLHSSPNQQNNTIKEGENTPSMLFMMNNGFDHCF